MVKFEKIKSGDNIAEVIKTAFTVDLDISGGWGYDEQSATIVQSLKITKNQFTNMFATIRATIEMNLTLEDKDRYTGINQKELQSEKITIDDENYEKITFEISGMDEKIYKDFIKEYKDGYGKKDFDLENHFKRRKENTIIRNEDYWFKFNND